MESQSPAPPESVDAGDTETRLDDSSASKVDRVSNDDLKTMKGIVDYLTEHQDEK